MSAPNRIDVIERVNRDHPGLIHRPHDFTAVAVAALHADDWRFGLNGKRGNPHDTSEDATAYLDESSPLVGSDGRRIRIIDFIGGANGPNPRPAWIDQTQATIDLRTTGVWVQPATRVERPPTPTPTPGPAPTPPPPAPSPDLAVIKAQLASIVEVLQVLLRAVSQSATQDQLRDLRDRILEGGRETPSVLEHIDDLKRIAHTPPLPRDERFLQ